MPKSVERCVKHVKNQKGVRDAWAICVAAHKKKLKRQRSHKSKSRSSRRGRGRRR